MVNKFRQNVDWLITTYYWLRAIALAFARLIPVCAAKDAPRLFLNHAATPPRRGH